MGWREAPDHAESVFDATRRRLPRLLRIRNKLSWGNVQRVV